MKLLVDMNLSPRWVELLAGAGHDAVHWSIIGDPGAPDTAIMQYARDNDRVVLTQDLDFGAILAVTAGHKPSVIQLRAENLSPEAIGKPVVISLRQMEAELISGALLTVEPGRTRVKLLTLP